MYTFIAAKKEAVGKVRIGGPKNKIFKSEFLDSLYRLRQTTASKISELEAKRCRPDTIRPLRLSYSRTSKWIEAEVQHLVKLDWEKTLNYMEAMDFTNRSKLFWKQIGTLRSRQADLFVPTSIKNTTGEHSTTERQFSEYWKNFYKNC